MEFVNEQKHLIIAQRAYLVFREGKKINLQIALTSPHEPKESTPFEGMTACTIFITPEISNGREILGRDAMEAIAHAILAIETRLIFLSKNGELFNIDETPAVIEDFGIFFGEIGGRYQKNLSSA